MASPDAIRKALIAILGGKGSVRDLVPELDPRGRGRFPVGQREAVESSQIGTPSGPLGPQGTELLTKRALANPEVRALAPEGTNESKILELLLQRQGGRQLRQQRHDPLDVPIDDRLQSFKNNKATQRRIDSGEIPF